MSKRILIIGGSGSGKKHLQEVIEKLPKGSDIDIITIDEAQEILDDIASEQKKEIERKDLITELVESTPWQEPAPVFNTEINRSSRRGNKESRRKKNFNHYS